MGAAAYVGRVGGLAVALGVGSAVFTGQGVAWADEADSSPSTRSTSATSDSDKTDRTEKTDDTAKADPTPETADAPSTPPKKTKRARSSNGTVMKRATEKPTPGTPKPTTSKTTKSTNTSNDAAAVPQQPKKVAVFATARTLAATNPTTMSPKIAAVPSTPSTPKPKLITAAVNVVDNMLDRVHQKQADDAPAAPRPSPLLALLSFARRELENLSAARTTTAAARSTVVAPTSLSLTGEPTAAAALVPYSPWLNPQVSPSTNFVSWVTGNTPLRRQDAGQHVGPLRGLRHGRRRDVGQRHCRRSQHTPDQRAPSPHRRRRHLQRRQHVDRLAAITRCSAAPMKTSPTE